MTFFNGTHKVFRGGNSDRRKSNLTYRFLTYPIVRYEFLGFRIIMGIKNENIS